MDCLFEFRNYYRVIVAGGGTGGTTVFFGEQLNHTNAEVVYIDFSSTSMKISQQRTRFRNLRNIIWINSWIEGIRFLGMGVFESVQSSGVLHHLKIPLLGLNILKDNLTNKGGLHIMVYGKYGRSAIYQTQELFGRVNGNLADLEFELATASQILNVLPHSNWFIQNPLVTDHKEGNIGIYDLFLHKRDTSFSIDMLLRWIMNAGLHFVEFDSFKIRSQLQSKFFDMKNLG